MNTNVNKRPLHLLMYNFFFKVLEEFVKVAVVLLLLLQVQLWLMENSNARWPPHRFNDLFPKYK